MEGQIFKDINTSLDLNGPYLSFTTDPSDQTSSAGSISYTGIATCSYGTVVGGTPENIGTVEYQWYEFSSGSTPSEYTGTKLTNGSGPSGTSYTVSGATTKTLTISSLVSGTDDAREFYVEASYKPAQVDYETGNPSNEPLNSVKAGLTIAPTINIISQPTSRNVGVDVETTFTVDANLSDGSGRALTYQWYIDGVAETDRTKTVTIDTSTTVASPFSYSWTGDANHTLPTTAYDIEVSIAGGAGAGGGYDSGGPGAGGGAGKGGTFDLEAPHFRGKELKFRVGSAGGGGGRCRGQCGGAGGVVSGPASNETKNINFNVTQDAGCSNEVTFAGHTFPSRNTGNHSVRITANTDYNVNASGSCGQSWIQVQGGGSTIGLDDSKPGGDNDYNDLRVTASEGSFSNANRTTATYRWSGGTSGGAGSGSRGGGAGNRGWSGAGGGAGAASFMEAPQGYIIVAGGGGGGGGGSWKRGGISHTPNGEPNTAKSFSAYPGPVPLSSGFLSNEAENSGDGGGGGGGGGGSPGNQSGNRGHDKNHGAYSGHGGGSRYDDPKSDLKHQWNQSGNGYAALNYWSTSDVPSSEQRRSVYKGTQTNTLRIKSDYNSAQNVYCKVSFSGATNTPVNSDTATFAVVPGTGNEMVHTEWVDDYGLRADLLSSNLRAGPIELNTTGGQDYSDDIVSIYAPDKDVPVYIDFYGGKGEDYQYADGNYSKGGRGGYGRISMTLKKNQEYVVAGLSTHINAPFLYEGGTLVATVGQGGDAGKFGAGGDGASFEGNGENATGIGGGLGASGTNPPIQANGVWGSSVIGYLSNTVANSYGDQIASNRDGGRTIICSKGTYWRQQGKGACDSLGTGKFVTSNGTTISSTASITRGFKSGWNVMATAGRGEKTSTGVWSGDGGTGARGGQGGSNNRGGGGGKGYVSSAVTVVSQSAGSHDDLAKLVIRLR